MIDRPIRIKGITKLRSEWQEILDEHTDKTSSSRGCWLWKGRKNSQNYGEIKIRSNTKTIYIRAHRLALIVKFSGERKERLACHHCDNPECVKPLHLYWGTNQDNQNDAVISKRVNGSGSMADPLHRGSAIMQSL